jgi:SAM-dependent methyltransferase
MWGATRSRRERHTIAKVAVHGGPGDSQHFRDVGRRDALVPEAAFVFETAGIWRRRVTGHGWSRLAPARVADLACGLGWSSIAIARAYPLVTVHAFDFDAAAIASAVDTATAEELTDRLSFTVADAADPGLSGRFDLATILEGLHDMAPPGPGSARGAGYARRRRVGADDRRARRRRVRGAPPNRLSCSGVRRPRRG